MTVQDAILEQIVEPNKGGFSAEHARYVLSLSFPQSVQARYTALSEKAQDGTLSESEQAELDAYLRTNALLMVLQSKARVSLRKHGAGE